MRVDGFGSNNRSLQADPRVGSVIQHRYRIIAPIAAGGMGVVYRAERLQLGRHVAIKFLHATMIGNKDFLRRFEQEAQAMSRLSHPNCVSVFDFGVEDAPYLVMDYVNGKTLRQLMDERRVSKARAVKIACQLLAGLAHAHKQQIIHRDVKPGNVMINEDVTGTGDHVRILDFGLAKLRGTTPSSDGASTMFAVGTPAYMPPEQIRGQIADARSDLYSVGILLFELLAGCKPFDSKDTIELLRMQTDRIPPSLAEIQPHEHFSAALERIIAQALQKDPTARMQSAEEFQHLLAETPEALTTDHPPRVALAPTIPAIAATGPFSAKGPTGDDPKDSAADPSLAARPTAQVRRYRPSLSLSSAPRQKAIRSPASGAQSGVAAPRHARTSPLVAAPGLARALLAQGSACLRRAVPSRFGLLLALLLGLVGVSSAATWLIWRRGQPSASANSHPAGARAPSGERPASANKAARQPSLVAAGELAPGGNESSAGAGKALATTLPSPPEAGATVGARDPLDPQDEEAEQELEQASATELAKHPDLVAGPEEDGDPPADHLPPVTANGHGPLTASLANVKRLARTNQTVAAIQMLRQLRQLRPKNASYALLMGHLYCQLKYFRDGLTAYLSAIKRQRRYRRSAALIRNTVAALGSRRASGRAAALIVRYIGRPARPYLRRAARQHPAPKARLRASYLLRRLH